MTQETTNNPRNYRTMTNEKSDEKLPTNTDLADNNFVLSDVENCINNIRRSEKRNSSKSQQIAKRLLSVGDSMVKNIEPYKMKKSAKYVTTVNSIFGVINNGIIHHV